MFHNSLYKISTIVYCDMGGKRRKMTMTNQRKNKNFKEVKHALQILSIEKGILKDETLEKFIKP